MNKKEIHLSSHESKKIQKNITRRQKVVKWVAALLIVCFLGGVGYAAYAFSGIFKNTNKFKSLFFAKKVNPNSLRGEGDGRINYLVMGYGGNGHQGGLLTDTIMVVSVDPYNKKVAMLSIPRDLYVEIPDYGYSKINAAYSVGENNKEEGNSGPELAKNTVSEILDLPIHYYITINFDGFRQLIDSVGGVDIYVDQSFTDSQYPDNNYGYQFLSFDAGWEHMGGERALQYSRSRYGSNGEGSDFARAKRQQKVLTALKAKILSLGFWSNPVKVSSLLSNLQNNFGTDLTPQELVKTFELAKDVKENEIAQKVLDNSATGLLVDDNTSDGQYILRPIDETWEAIRALAHSIFVEPFIEKENATILISNASGVSGNAKDVADLLTGRGYQEVTYEGAENLEENTKILDCSDGEKPYTLQLLKKRFLNVPDESCGVDKSADFVIILGQDFDYNNFISNQI
ncbi:MAG: LCP family protein [Patescibacteria group bacterium]|nr:LCP family protein [Patescibacteria group bacterium]